MAGNGTVTLKFRVDDVNGGMKELIVDADSLKKVIERTVKVAKDFNAKAINFASIATGIDQAQQSIAQFQSALKGLTDAYQVQKVAETQLETVMRQRMKATDAEISSIKQLASAQQELGVIGDEVQLSGAQQMATFLNQKRSLEVLIPAMNNLIAQQNGLNATNQDAVTVGNLMGKAMQGQVSALTRVGITFNEAQAHVMKFGTESQRAAMLAKIITQNVGEMNAELAKTDVGEQKQRENRIGDYKELAGSLAQVIMPLVTFSATAALALSGFMKFVAGVRAAGGALKGLTLASTIATAKTFRLAVAKKLLGAAMVMGTGSVRKAATAMRLYDNAAKGSVARTVALKVALRGLLISTGIGAAIAALTWAISALTSSADAAADSIDGMTEAQRRAKEAADEQKRLVDETTQGIEMWTSKIKTFSGTKSEEQKMLDELNNTYGETFGYFDKLSQWYDVLKNNVSDYVELLRLQEGAQRQVANLSHLRDRKEQIDNSTPDVEIDREKTRKMEKSNPQGMKNKVVVRNRKTGEFSVMDAGDYNDATNRRFGINSMIGRQEQELDKTNTRIQEIIGRVHTGKDRPTPAAVSQPSHSPSATREQTEMQRLSAEIEKKKEQYTTASDADRQTLRSEIEGLETRKAALQNLLNEAGRPLKLDSESDFDKELQYLRGMRSQAAREELAGYDAKIKEVEQKRREFTEAAHKPVPLEKIDTYEALSAELDHYSGKLQYATTAEREEIRKQINALNSLKEQWDTLLDGLDSPGPVETLDTLGKIEKAISYVDARIQQASGNELAALERQKNAYEAKRRAMMRTVELTDMRDETDRIDGLSGKSRRREISAIGYDGLTDKISELRRQLDDVKNPVTDEQRRDIESLIETYETWRRESIDTWGSLRQGYGEIKNVGNAITGITDAIDGNGNAWEKLTGIVDGFLQLFDGIKAIVDIINLMTAATKQHTTAKQTEKVVTMGATGATVADTLATETDIGVKSGDAIANATKSGAALPFPLNLVAIAAGVAAVIGALAMIGSFSTGGIVGGSSPQGDRLLARVNSGEMILNKAQQTRLYNALNGNGHLAAASAAVTRGGGGEPQIGVSPDVMRLVVAASRQPVVVGGTMRVSGRDLVCTLANETRIASRSGRRTGIRL